VLELHRRGEGHEFLIDDDSLEKRVREGDWVEGSEAFRRRLYQPRARAVRPAGRPRKPRSDREGLFPEFIENKGDA
jgi:hypothetical protein